MLLVNRNIDSDKAKEIAIGFFRQHHSIIDVDEPVLKDGIWRVTVTVSSGWKKRQALVDAKTGKIIAWRNNLKS